MSTINKEVVKQAARGRWIEIFSTIAGVQLDPSCQKTHGPCPKCGGNDRFRALDISVGALFCNKCFSTNNGDGISALSWLTGKPFKDTLIDLADFLNIKATKASASSASSATHTKTKTHATVRGLVMAIVPPMIKKYGSGVKLVATWHYPTFAVLRFNLPTPAGEKQRKEFRPIRQSPIGSEGVMGWRTGYPEGPRPLYCLPDVLAADPAIVTIHGGEKAVDSARGLGLVATTNAGGEQAVKRTDWTPLARFKLAAIVVDNDAAGEKFGRMVASVLKSQNPEQIIKIVRLPNLPPKGDVVEWIAAGGTKEQFGQVVESMPEVTNEEATAWAKEKRSVREKNEKQISNAIIEHDEEGKETATPRPMNEIVSLIIDQTGNALHRVDKSLFAHIPGGNLDWIQSTPSLFGFLQSLCGTISWKRGEGFVTKEELFCDLQRQLLNYDAVENMPFWPPIATHYYTCAMPPAVGDGTALDTLIGFHCFESDLDRELAVAMYATPVWGGPPGMRPAHIITAPTGRGKGKSALVQHFSRLYGGMIDVSPQEEISVIKQRLLSPEAASKRIATIDNLKSARFSWGDFENLITAATINGKRLYVGDANRPNLLTWTITLNGASLSTDMSQRVVEIRLREPDYQGGWEETVARFIDENREKIIADCIEFLKLPSKPMNRNSRWATWESQVLAKVDHPNECLDLILLRRKEADVEEEESGIIEEFFAGKLTWLGYDADRDDIFIPNEVAARWYNAATGENKKTTGVTRSLKQLHEERRIHRLIPCRNSDRTARGFRWVGEFTDSIDVTHYDIRHRLAEKIQNQKETTQRY